MRAEADGKSIASINKVQSSSKPALLDDLPCKNLANHAPEGVNIILVLIRSKHRSSYLKDKQPHQRLLAGSPLTPLQPVWSD